VSEDQSNGLEIDDILGVAMSGIRGAAFTDMAEELTEKTQVIVDAYRQLHVALDTAASRKAEDAEYTVTAEDHAVVAASKAYAKAEGDYLWLLKGYLEFVAQYSIPLSGIAGDSGTGGLSGLRGLIPGA